MQGFSKGEICKYFLYDETQRILYIIVDTEELNEIIVVFITNTA